MKTKAPQDTKTCIFSFFVTSTSKTPDDRMLQSLDMYPTHQNSFQLAKMSSLKSNSTVRGASINMEKKLAAIAARRVKRALRAPVDFTAVRAEPCASLAEFPPLGLSQPVVDHCSKKGDIRSVTISRNHTLVRWKPFYTQHSVTTLQEHERYNLDPSTHGKPRFAGKVINLAGNAPRIQWLEGRKPLKMVYHRKPAFPCPKGEVSPLPEFVPPRSKLNPNAPSFVPTPPPSPDFSRFLTADSFFFFNADSELPLTFDYKDVDDPWCHTGLYAVDDRVDFNFKTWKKLPRYTESYKKFCDRLISLIDTTIYKISDHDKKFRFPTFAFNLWQSQFRFPRFKTPFHTSTQEPRMSFGFYLADTRLCPRFKPNMMSSVSAGFGRFKSFQTSDDLIRFIENDYSQRQTVINVRDTMNAALQKQHIADPILTAQGSAMTRMTNAADGVTNASNSISELVEDIRSVILRAARTDPTTLENNLLDSINAIFKACDFQDCLMTIFDGNYIYGCLRLLMFVSSSIYDYLVKLTLQTKIALMEVSYNREATRLKVVSDFVLRHKDYFLSLKTADREHFVQLFAARVNASVDHVIGDIHYATALSEIPNYTPPLLTDLNRNERARPNGTFNTCPVSPENLETLVNRIRQLPVPPRPSTSLDLADFDQNFVAQGFGNFFNSSFATLFKLTSSSLPTLQRFNTLCATAKNASWIVDFVTSRFPSLFCELLTPLFGEVALGHDDLKRMFERLAAIQQLEHSAYEGVSLDEIDALLKIAHEFRTMVATSLFKGVSPVLISGAIRDLAKIRLMKTDREQFAQPRYTPFTVLFHGAPGIGKSQLLPIVAKWFNEEFDDDFYSRDPILKAMTRKRTTYALQPQLEYMDGYSRDAVVIQDEALSQTCGDSEKQLLSLISNNIYVCPMASLEDGVIGKKGTTFTSAVALFASNIKTVEHLSNVFIDTTALNRRFRLRVFVEKVGELNPNFSHLRFTITDYLGKTYHSHLTFSQLLYFFKASPLGIRNWFQNEAAIASTVITAQPFDLSLLDPNYQTQGGFSIFTSSFFTNLANQCFLHPRIVTSLLAAVVSSVAACVILYKRPTTDAQSYTMNDRTAQRQRRVVKDPLAQGLSMNASDALLDKLKGHIHMIFAMKDGIQLTSMNAIPLHGVMFICPKHLFENNPDTITLDWFAQEREYTTSNFLVHDVDTDVVCLEVPHLPWRAASFYRSLPDKSDLDRLKQTPACVFSVMSDYPTVFSVMLQPLTSKCTYRGTNTSYTILNGFTYEANTHSGDCGGPIVVCDNDIRGKLVGMHVAGTSNATYAIGISFFKESFSRFIDGSVLDPALCTTQGAITTIGVVRPPVHASKNTKFIHYPHNPPLPQVKRPADLHPKDGLDPVIAEMRKNDHFQSTFQPTSNEREMIMEFFNAHRQPMRVLTDIETVTGAEGLENINLNTSCGYPYCLQYDKHDFFHVDEQGHWSIRNDLPLQSMRQMEVVARTRPPYVIWKTSGKDELLKPGKNIRIFEIPPLDYTLCFRKYFGSFLGWFSTHPLELFVAIGMNPESFHWDKMVRSMLKHNDVGFNTDWTRYDSTVPFVLISLVTEIANDWYDDDFSEVRRNLTRCLFNRPTVFEHLLYGIVCGLPSGFAGTAVFNSLVHVMIVMIYYLRRSDLRHRDLHIMHDHLAFYVYGDDGILVPDPEISYIFDWDSFKEFATSLGMIPTPALKDASDPHCPVLSMTFLKRSIAYDRGLYVPQLSTESMFSMLTWIRKSKYATVEESYRVNLRTFYGFAYFYGKQFYREWSARFGFAPSFDYFDQLFRSGSMDLSAIVI